MAAHSDRLKSVANKKSSIFDKKTGMVVSEIELFQILSQQLGTEKAKALVEYVETKVDKRLDDKSNVFTTKEDIATLRGELKTEIALTKAEIIKWMFIFWVGQLASFIAIAKFIFHQ